MVLVFDVVTQQHICDADGGWRKPGCKKGSAAGSGGCNVAWPEFRRGGTISLCIGLTQGKPRRQPGVPASNPRSGPRAHVLVAGPDAGLVGDVNPVFGLQSSVTISVRQCAPSGGRLTGARGWSCGAWRSDGGLEQQGARRCRRGDSTRHRPTAKPQRDPEPKKTKGASWAAWVQLTAVTRKNWLRGLDLNQRPSGYEPVPFGSLWIMPDMSPPVMR